jgi:hypothetical protein
MYVTRSEILPRPISVCLWVLCIGVLWCAAGLHAGRSVCPMLHYGRGVLDSTANLAMQYEGMSVCVCACTVACSVAAAEPSCPGCLAVVGGSFPRAWGEKKKKEERKEKRKGSSGLDVGQSSVGASSLKPRSPLATGSTQVTRLTATATATANYSSTKHYTGPGTQAQQPAASSRRGDTLWSSCAIPPGPSSKHRSGASHHRHHRTIHHSPFTVHRPPDLSRTITDLQTKPLEARLLLALQTTALAIRGVVCVTDPWPLPLSAGTVAIQSAASWTSPPSESPKP